MSERRLDGDASNNDCANDIAGTHFPRHGPGVDHCRRIVSGGSADQHRRQRLERLADHIALEVTFEQKMLDPKATGDPETIGKGNFGGLVKKTMRAAFPDVKGRRDKRKLYRVVSSGAAFQLREMAMADPTLIGTTQTVWVPADDDIDMLMKGYIDRELPESDRRVSNQVLGWVDQLVEQGRIERRFNMIFFTAGDSREPELSGIRGALMGSLYMLLVTLVLSFPTGVGAAIYLEEFAPRNRLTDFVEVNINNLAAVPSIVFGLLGLAVLNFFELPRSAPLVGADTDDAAHHHIAARVHQVCPAFD